MHHVDMEHAVVEIGARDLHVIAEAKAPAPVGSKRPIGGGRPRNCVAAVR